MEEVPGERKTNSTFLSLTDACQKLALLKGAPATERSPELRVRGVGFSHLCFRVDSLCAFAQVRPCPCGCWRQEVLTEVPLTGP